MVDIANDHGTATRPATSTTTNPLVPDRDVTGRQPANTAGTAATDTIGDRRRGESAVPGGTRSAAATRYLLAGIRLALGWVFLWAFLDKTFGLGHETVAAKSWLNGGSPTQGFLGSAAKGPFAGFYHSIAGAAVTDVLFMAALLGVGVALILGIGMRLAAGAGALLTVMMWTAVLPPASNPFMDDHLVYAAVLIVLALLGAGNTLGLGRVWTSLPLVRRAPWLR
jgi:thiosulfate dehydrogenase [quinone] large subunit